MKEWVEMEVVRVSCVDDPIDVYFGGWRCDYQESNHPPIRPFDNIDLTHIVHTIYMCVSIIVDRIVFSFSPN